MGCFRTPIASIRSSILPLFVDFDFGLGFLAEFTDLILRWTTAALQGHEQPASKSVRNRILRIRKTVLQRLVLTSTFSLSSSVTEWRSLTKTEWMKRKSYVDSTRQEGTIKAQKWVPTEVPYLFFHRTSNHSHLSHLSRRIRGNTKEISAIDRPSET